MRTLFGVGMVAVLAAAAGGQEKKPDAKAEKLDGTYLVVGFEQGGQKVPEDEIKKRPEAQRIVKIAGDKLTSTRDGKEDPVSVKFDPTKTPKHFTATEIKAGGKAETVVGIYKLEGDTLTLCTVESDKEADRPKEFKTEKGSGAMIMTLKRVKDK